VFCDEYGAGARREITHKVPPLVRFFTKFRTTTKNWKILQKTVKAFANIMIL